GRQFDHSNEAVSISSNRFGSAETGPQAVGVLRSLWRSDGPSRACYSMPSAPARPTCTLGLAAAADCEIGFRELFLGLDPSYPAGPARRAMDDHAIMQPDDCIAAGTDEQRRDQCMYETRQRRE